MAFGSNGNGQLSIGHDDDTHIPTTCIIPESCPTTQPVKIVAGGNHTLVLYPCGTVLASGLNTNGQCGIRVDEGPKSFSSFRVVPAPLEEDAKWVDISAGWEFSVFVSSTGNVYTCGLGNKGELGQGSTVTVLHELRKLESFPPATCRITSISSGMAHTLAVLDNGDVYGWGAGRKGQLGEPVQAVVPSPRRIDLSFPAATAACGREFGFVVSRDGSRHQVLGGEKYNVKGSQPAQGALKGCTSVQASWGGVCVLLGDGSITAWGRNDKGQLPHPGLREVEQMAIGSEHGLAILKGSEGKLVAWGWGEHGNCGRSKDVNGGDVIGEDFEVSYSGTGRPVGVGAGCATSWVIST